MEVFMVKLTKEQQNISWKNRRLAREHFFGSKEGRKGWCLHHKDETLRKRDIDRYIQWRIEDLVPMTISEHSRYHNDSVHNPNIGKHCSDEAKRKISVANSGRRHSSEFKERLSEAMKGENNPMFGRTHSDETKRKIGDANKGNHSFFGRTHSDEAKQKMSDAHKGMETWNKGIPCSLETKLKIGESKKGRLWWNNGVKCVMARECPEGFVAGRLKKS